MFALGQVEARDDRRDAARRRAPARSAACRPSGSAAAARRAPLEGVAPSWIASESRRRTSPGGPAPSSSTSSSAPAGAASRSSRSSSRRDLLDVLAGREADREVRLGQHRQHRLLQLRRAALDPVHVDARARPRCAGRTPPPPRVGGRAPRPRRAPGPPAAATPSRRAPRSVGGAMPGRSGSGRRPSGPASTAESIRSSAWIAFSAAPPYEPECRSCSPVRSRTWK